MKRFLITTLIGTFFFVGNATAFAVASQEVQQAADKVQASVDELLTLKDTELSDEEKLVEEFEARKKVLQQVFELSLKELEDLNTKLSSFQKLTPDDLELRDRFLEALAGYLTYYQDFQEQFEKAITLDSIKELAKTMKAWRETDYDPVIKEVADFIVVLQSEEFLTVAHTRLQKISTDINKLEKAGFIEVGRFDEALELASKNLVAAGISLRDAHSLVLLKNAPVPEDLSPQEETPSQSSLSQPSPEPLSSSSETDPVTPSRDELTPPQPTPRDFVQSGLDQIKATYTIFIEISVNVRKVLKL